MFILLLQVSVCVASVCEHVRVCVCRIRWVLRFRLLTADCGESEQRVCAARTWNNRKHMTAQAVSGTECVCLGLCLCML